ncbi:MAG: formate--tetrahydrofolate ligase [Candidatus Omnitrophota bacterium]
MKSLKPIKSVAKLLRIKDCELEYSGQYKAKINLSILKRLPSKKRSKYILISAMTPTALGEGKTLTTIGLSMALNALRLKAAATLRQSSLGPLFGAKGAAGGAGLCTVLPADEVNLHLTGDMHAVGVANNLLVSFLENSIFHGNPLKIDANSITIKRCLDINDRSLRHIHYVLKSGHQKFEISTGFEITAASEIMSILTLSRDFDDMRRRLSNIIVAKTYDGNCVSARDLRADGMMCAILKEAIKPNLVQTSEGTPCFIHSGPFANISIGASSIIADRIALGLCDYVVTESGFGADCGAEKFFDIKCRYSGLKPDVCVLVCSTRALKAQSGKFHVVPGQKIDQAIYNEDIEALQQGAVNLKKQISNITLFGVPVIVCLNVFSTDTRKELDYIKEKSREFGALDCVESTVYQEGSKGALSLARSVVKHANRPEPALNFLYEDETSLAHKIETIAKKVYGAGSVEYSQVARQQLDFYESKGFGRLPVCIAKTQFSLSHNEALKGAPSGFVFPVKDVRLASGAGFILAHASLMQTMPGLPSEPRGEKVDVDVSGEVTGLF